MAFTMTVLPGLPPYGEPAIGVNATGVGVKVNSEYFVVKFSPGGVPSWIGNFVGGLGGCTLARLHPNGQDALIISSGEGYIVDPYARKLLGNFGGAIEEVFEYAPLNALIINHQNIDYEAIGPSGRLWRSQVSIDGIRNVQIEGATLSGESWWGDDDKWYPFHLDLNTGEVIGGSYG